jgi:hypothetical protein
MTAHVSDYAAEVYGIYLAMNVHANIQASPGRHCRSALSLAAIDGHSSEDIH